MSIEDEIVKLKELITSDKSVEAIEFMKSIEERIFDGDLESKSKPEEISDYEFFVNIPEVKLIQWDENLYYRCLDNIKKATKTHPSYKDDKGESWYFEEDDTNCITIVNKVIVNSHIKKILLSLLDFQHLNSLSEEKFGKLEILKHITKNRSLVKTILKMPLFKDRVCINYGNNFINHKNKQILMLTRSITEEDLPTLQSEDMETKLKTENMERIDLKFSFHTLKKIDKDQYEFISGLNADAKLTLVPDYFYNNFLKETSRNICLFIKQLIEDPSNDKIYEEGYLKYKSYYDELITLLE